MRFGVHNHYNNNTIGQVEQPEMGWRSSCSYVVVTDKGLTFFILPKKYSLEEKLFLAKEIEERLKEEFGFGTQFSFAMSSTSDCVKGFELEPYFNAMKELTPDIKTIYKTYKNPDGSWDSPKNLTVDAFIDEWSNTVAEDIASAVSSDESDIAKPAEGWDAFGLKLKKVYQAAAHATDAYIAEKKQEQKNTATSAPLRPPSL